MIAPSERIMALVSGYAAAERMSRILAIFQTYTDDSGRGDPSTFVLAGYVSTASRWAAFSDEWKSALGRIEYFKTKEAAALQGQFARVSSRDRDHLVAQLCRIIIKHVEYGIRGVIDVQAWERIALGRYHKSTDFPYTFLANDIICTVMDEQYKRGLAGTVDFIFDTQAEREFNHILRGWDVARSGNLPLNQLMPRHFRRRFGQRPYMLDDKVTMPLQAADLLAWTSYRSASDGLKDSESPLVEVIASEFRGHPIMTQIWDEADIAEYFGRVEASDIDTASYRAAFKPSRRQRRRMRNLE